MPADTNTMLMALCTTMNTRPSSILLRKRKSPLTTSMGLMRSTSVAGTRAASSATSTRPARPTATEVTSLKRGRKAKANRQPSRKQKAVKRRDSAI